jgi:hypothetical protein
MIVPLASCHWVYLGDGRCELDDWRTIIDLLARTVCCRMQPQEPSQAHLGVVVRAAAYAVDPTGDKANITQRADWDRHNQLTKLCFFSVLHIDTVCVP